MALLLRYLTATDAGLAAGTSMEPVALADALVNLRVDSDASDAAQIASIFLPAARQLAETKAGAAIRLASYRQTLSEFPWTRDSRNGFSSSGSPMGHRSSSAPIKTALGLVQSITSVKYIDTTGAVQTIDPTTLSLVQLDEANTEIALTYGGYWPACAHVPNAVTVEYTAGMAPADFAARFPGVNHWILLACGWAYANREMFLSANGALIQMPASYVDSLLAPITVSPRF